MARLADTNPYKIHLVKLLHFLEKENPMTPPEIVLILINLDTEEKILRFCQWLETKIEGERYAVDKHQIIGASVRISKGRTDLP